LLITFSHSGCSVLHAGYELHEICPSVRFDGLVLPVFESLSGFLT
jgi:hypothetical protein